MAWPTRFGQLRLPWHLLRCSFGVARHLSSRHDSLGPLYRTCIEPIWLSLLAIIGLCVIIFAEYYYRTGVEKQCVLRRFLLLSSIEVLVIALAHGVQWIWRNRTEYSD